MESTPKIAGAGPLADYAVGQRVNTKEGFPGVITDIHEGPADLTTYWVALDNGMGGGEYAEGEIWPEDKVVAVVDHTAADDYPELGTILSDRLPPQIRTVGYVQIVADRYDDSHEPAARVEDEIYPRTQWESPERAQQEYDEAVQRREESEKPKGLWETIKQVFTGGAAIPGHCTVCGKSIVVDKGVLTHSDGSNDHAVQPSDGAPVGIQSAREALYLPPKAPADGASSENEDLTPAQRQGYAEGFEHGKAGVTRTYSSDDEDYRIGYDLGWAEGVEVGREPATDFTDPPPEPEHDITFLADLTPRGHQLTFIELHDLQYKQAGYFFGEPPVNESYKGPGRFFSYDWCRFRRDNHCWLPKDLNVEASEQMGYAVWIPEDRGHCPRVKWELQQKCPTGEPGPHSGPGGFTDATVPFDEGGQQDGRPSPFTRRSSFHMTATWKDVQAKAKQIRSSGGVRIVASQDNVVTGHVRGSSGVYETEVVRTPGRKANVAYWACGCRWASYSWGRSGPWKRYEGRMCSHALALQYEAQARGMFGRDLTLDEKQPEWMDPTIPVRRPGDYDRDKGRYSAKHPVWTFDEIDVAPVTLMAHAMLAEGKRYAEIREMVLSFGAKEPVSIIREARTNDFKAKVRGLIKSLFLDDDGTVHDRSSGQEIAPTDVLYPGYHPTRGLSIHDTKVGLRRFAALFDGYTDEDMKEAAEKYGHEQPHIIDRSHDSGFIATVHGYPVGQITWTVEQDPRAHSETEYKQSKGDYNGYYLRIDTLVVDRAFRRKGIATLLLNHFIGYADRRYGFVNGPGSGWDPGKFTADGAAFWRAVRGETVPVTQGITYSVLRTTADEDQCPYCAGDSLMTAGVYTCEEGHQWRPSDPAARAYHEGTGKLQPLALLKTVRASGTNLEAAARAMLEMARRNEPQTTSLMVSLADRYHAELAGLDHRFKSEGSLLRKMKSEINLFGGDAGRCAYNMSDTLRYTMLIEPDGYTAAVEGSLSALRSQGYKTRTKNYWLRGDAYNGINVACHTPTGHPFELQFHTEESFRIKEEIVHPIYEKFRDETDPTTRKRLFGQMRDAYDWAHRPPNALRIDDLKKQVATIQPLGFAFATYQYWLLHTNFSEEVLCLIRAYRGTDDFRIELWDDGQWKMANHLSHYVLKGEPRSKQVTEEEAMEYISSDPGHTASRADEWDSVFGWVEAGTGAQQVTAADEFGFEEPSYNFDPDVVWAPAGASGTYPDAQMTPGLGFDEDPEAALPITYGDEDDSGPVTMPDSVGGNVAARTYKEQGTATYNPDEAAQRVRAALAHPSTQLAETAQQKGARLLREHEARMAALEAGVQPTGPDPYAHLMASPADQEAQRAAQEFLAKTSLKTFTPAERKQIIDEGIDVEAGNLDQLDIEGTHYEALDQARAKAASLDADDLWMMDNDGNPAD